MKKNKRKLIMREHAGSRRNIMTDNKSTQRFIEEREREMKEGGDGKKEGTNKRWNKGRKEGKERRTDT